MRLKAYILQITVPETRRQDTSEIYTKLTMAQLKKQVPQIVWEDYFYNVLLAKLDEDEPIVFYSLPYFIELGKVLVDTDRRLKQVFWYC